MFRIPVPALADLVPLCLREFAAVSLPFKSQDVRFTEESDAIDVDPRMERPKFGNISEEDPPDFSLWGVREVRIIHLCIVEPVDIDQPAEPGKKGFKVIRLEKCPAFISLLTGKLRLWKISNDLNAVFILLYYWCLVFVRFYFSHVLSFLFVRLVSMTRGRITFPPSFDKRFEEDRNDNAAGSVETRHYPSPGITQERRILPMCSEHHHPDIHIVVHLSTVAATSWACRIAPRLIRTS
ncbi:hypothetical protein [Methanoregula formicica]|uniref:hypothetical protein n=1 Tax=Methanoregula formicica TaxID=882104 RepID=UPI0011D2B0C7|nr:hypothetical protein [Methanoregula formicica]